tara:strand:- start:647 stop:2116 length:1470 start_codon:yes stop_codon:yes gene_type:complete
MRDLIKKILQEQETSDDNVVQAGTYNDYDAWREMTPEERKGSEMPKQTRQVEKNIFLKILRHVVMEFPKSWFIEHANNDNETLGDKIEPEFNKIFKLYGLGDPAHGGYPEPGSMWAKVFYAALDNYDFISTGRDKELYELKLRTLKTWDVGLNEGWREHVNYRWTVTLQGYNENDVRAEVSSNQDGEYDWWEWDHLKQSQFEKEVYDSDRDGIEIETIKEINKNNIPQPSPGIVIRESKEDLVSGLKTILKKWKESRTENRWYDEIEDLLKRVNENPHKKQIVEAVIDDPNLSPDEAGLKPAKQIFQNNEWLFMKKLIDDGLEKYSSFILDVAEGEIYKGTPLVDLAKLYAIPLSVDDRLHLIAAYMKAMLSTSRYELDPTDAYSKLENGSFYEIKEYELIGNMFQTTWEKSKIVGNVEGFGPTDAAKRFASDIWEYDPEIEDDYDYNMSADRETEEIEITQAIDYEDGKEYDGLVEWSKGYGAKGKLK